MKTVLLGILGGLGTPEILIIVFIILLLFGGRKIPELMRGLGQGREGIQERFQRQRQHR
jgi:sec-independent protein translocase protein TatA